MFGVSLLVLGAVCMATAKLSYIGPCDVNVETQQDFDFDKFSTENGGKWKFVNIPATPALSDFNGLDLTTTPTGKPGEYHTVIYSTFGLGEKAVFADEIVENNGNGVVTAKTKDGTEFKIYFLKYVPSKYAFYYICSKDGGDKSFDYRYVLSHGSLSDDEAAEIEKLNKNFNFKGELRDISIVLH